MIEGYAVRRGDVLMWEGEPWIVRSHEWVDHRSSHPWLLALKRVRDGWLAKLYVQDDDEFPYARVRGGRYNEDQWRWLIENNTGARPY